MMVCVDQCVSAIGVMEVQVFFQILVRVRVGYHQVTFKILDYLCCETRTEGCHLKSHGLCGIA
jgi:hypothetical protein